MRRTTITAAIATTALLLTACGGGGGGSEETTSPEAGDSETSAEETSAAPEGEEEETVAVRGDEDLVIWTDDVKLDAVTAAAEAFGEANGISVGVQAIVNTRTDFITANEAGNGPDVLVGAHDWIGQLVANGAIDPLQLGADALGGYAERAVSAVTYNGQLYGIPYGVESLVLYCNTAYAPDTYATLDDAIAAGQAAKDAGQVDSALNVAQGVDGDPYNMQPLYTSAGGYLFGLTADGTPDPADLGVGTPEGQAAAAKLAELGSAGSGVLSTAISGDNAIALFADGRAGCLISGPWALGDVTTGLGEDGFTVQPIPGFAGMGPAVPFMGAQAFYVASNGANKSFAQAFVTGTTGGALNSEDTMQILFDNANLPPAMTSVREAAAAADPLVGVFGDAADQAQPMPAIPAMDQVWTPLGQAYAAIIGGADPAGTMTTAGETISAAIASS
ncbi:sugar ABC transporter substrate-binding protein [Serinibacter arcticus]|uniref:Maltose/maltodextrin ABC transporter, substrate binding periplasmic protein MalE n=1 Tax=Serinibacter arcticus TaxID=1655435 RepID=A0A4Z1E1K4_9MICO|nr:extracellular solute-binding protein [Serinibacter arcticus]TGO04403.1 Maltose/maltodextrin ABC transporter, substrate binding periplasmic protein MalE [Serinibacter arcticus]